ncbi:nitroreductase [Sphingomonas vulcanisoli]|uniref:Putative NAD(P)H nitroreductase n=1 Tax=Sphingomonas vulcanisoli TaxID=1658060 RepID=A0ABX0TVK5_9SPHN|nr:nitroreductase [Sphingomonas vulcanisoli]NIJ07810.1 nitroreductase [Sphingomonas vulcanisoli]
MFNDRTSTQSLLATRRSGKPRDMIAPGPSPDQMERILAAAIRVPDHGKLAPWRFVVVPGDKRADFAKLLHNALEEQTGTIRETPYEVIEQFAHQAPALVVALSCPVRPSKIPVWEQELSVGAACMNLLIAAHAEGFVGGWLTGWASYSPMVCQAFGGGPDDRIAGFIFLGIPSRPQDERPRPEPSDVIGVWRGLV